MAPLGFRIVEYGIYTVPFFFSPHQGQRTGCREEDVQLFLTLIPYMYDHTRSLVRSQVNILHAHIGWHGNKLGTFKDSDFFAKLFPQLKEGASGCKRKDFNIPLWEDVKDSLTNNVQEYQDAVQ